MAAFFAPEFTPFFRALEEISQPQARTQRHGGSRSFSPKFDVWETSDKYVIQGELPGAAMENVSIEWHKDTLQISGKVTHSKYTRNTSPSPATGAEETQVAEGSSSTPTKDNQATVEEDYIVANAEKGETEAPVGPPAETTPTANQAEDKGKAVADTTAENSNKQCTRYSQYKRCGGGNGDSFRYWVSERSYGQFNRTFSFPTTIAHDGISATLDNGILEVRVPKTQAPAPHRVQISRS